MGPVLFLPGIIAPATVRYSPLLDHLPDISAVCKDLEVYAGEEPPSGYAIGSELDGVDRAADEAGFGTFHLYGHSGGGAVGLAYAVARGERLLSLAVDEPAHDFTAEGDAVYGWGEFEAAATLPEPDATRSFMSLQLAPDVPPPSPPPGPAPPWMAKCPAGIRAFIAALRSHHIDPDRYQAFRAPVYFSRGTRSHPRWTAMHERLSKLFPDFAAEVYEGLHHLNTSHQAEPGRVARALKNFWGRAEHG
ncbi:MAG: alpha/beta fold hydrolase [Actinomycetota bacterium]